MRSLKELFNTVRASRGVRDRGAVLVEAAIAIPILLLVILGSVEFGFGWDAKSSNTAAVRTGLLRAASIGDQPETDMRILQSIIGEIGAENVDRIDWVVLFEIDGPDHQTTINDCINTPGTDCVLYPTPILQAISVEPDPGTYQTTNFDTGAHFDTATGVYNCDVGKLDSGNFCAGARTAGGGDIEIGLAVQLQHEWTTGILPFNPPVFTDIAVTSTFVENGADISPTGVVLPSSVGQVFTTNFGPGSDLSAFTSTAGSNPVQVDSPPGHSAQFLGRFGSDTVVLNVDTPQAAAQQVEICVSFTLWIIGSWDGTDAAHGPDRFTLDIGNDANPESSDTYDAGTQNDDFDYGGFADDARPVQISECSLHQGGDIDISFAGVLSSTSLNNESWAISDLNVTLMAP